jgi:hypothetical protein
LARRRAESYLRPRSGLPYVLRQLPQSMRRCVRRRRVCLLSRCGVPRRLTDLMIVSHFRLRSRLAAVPEASRRRQHSPARPAPITNQLGQSIEALRVHCTLSALSACGNQRFVRLPPAALQCASVSTSRRRASSLAADVASPGHQPLADAATVSTDHRRCLPQGPQLLLPKNRWCRV